MTFPSYGQELRLEITGRRNPLKSDIFPLIYGKVENDSVIIFEKSYTFDPLIQGHLNSSPESAGSRDSGNAPPGTLRSPKDSETVRRPSVLFESSTEPGQAPPPAVLIIKNIDSVDCVSSKKTAEILLLIKLLMPEINRISISSPRKNDCYTFLSSKLSESKPLAVDQDALPDKIRIRLHFERQLPVVVNRNIGGKDGAPSLSGEKPAPAGATTNNSGQDPAAGPGTRIGGPLKLVINGDDVEVNKDGWFVYEPPTTDSMMVSVRQGDHFRFLRAFTPALLKSGTTERSSPHYRYAFLVTNAEIAAAMITTERLDFRSLVDVSLPFYLKFSYGNTRLFPLPGEGKIDRPTLLFGVKTHPIAYGMHIESEGFFSVKSESQIPWTSLITGVIGSDFMELGDNLSIPWGVGVRAFKSKIDNSKAAAGSEGSPNGRTVIPESVLGPAASVGVKYRNNYIFSDATLIITPLQIPGSDLIVTYNPTLYLGYQLTGADTLTLSYQSHDVRFPTTTGVVKVTASIIALGYMRDLK